MATYLFDQLSRFWEVFGEERLKFHVLACATEQGKPAPAGIKNIRGKINFHTRVFSAVATVTVLHLSDSGGNKPVSDGNGSPMPKW